MKGRAFLGSHQLFSFILSAQIWTEMERSKHGVPNYIFVHKLTHPLCFIMTLKREKKIFSYSFHFSSLCKPNKGKRSIFFSFIFFFPSHLNPNTHTLLKFLLLSFLLSSSFSFIFIPSPFEINIYI